MFDVMMSLRGRRSSARSNLQCCRRLLTALAYGASVVAINAPRNDILYCCHSLPIDRAITRAILLAKLSLEGKNDGCGAPEGLPLIVRFSPSPLPLSHWERGRGEGLAPFRNGEPSSSSTLTRFLFSQSPCAAFPFVCSCRLQFSRLAGLYRKKYC